MDILPQQPSQATKILQFLVQKGIIRRGQSWILKILPESFWGGPSLEISTKLGPMCVPVAERSASCIICRQTIQETQESNLIAHLVKEMEMDVVIDIGSHMGWYARLAANVNPKVQVFAFEPDPLNFAYVEYNLKNIPNAECFLSGVGEAAGNGYLWKGTTSNLNSTVRKVGTPLPINIISLDALFKERKLEKIDFFTVLVSPENNYNVLNELIPLKKPILIEKPIVFSSKKIDELIELNKNYNTKIMVALNRRFYSVFEKGLKFLKNVKKILAICWGMQVAVTAAGGEVKKAEKSHIGIANHIMINNVGLKYPIYKDKNNNFNSPAFNFDEVVKLPTNGICLASNKINKIQSLYFETNNTCVWGLQYHPEITYEKMISLIEFRKDKLIENRKAFKNEEEIKNHISFIKEEIAVSNKAQRMLELKNWLDNIK